MMGRYTIQRPETYKKVKRKTLILSGKVVKEEKGRVHIDIEVEQMLHVFLFMLGHKDVCRYLDTRYHTINYRRVPKF